MASSSKTSTAKAANVISSLTDLKDFIDSIPSDATLYLDLEATRLIDVRTLGSAAFTTPGTNGKTIKAILEDSQISKCFWDVRLAGITDIQLLENASRIDGRTYVRGLDTCVKKDLGLGFMELHRWVGTKKAITTRMADDIFSRRPLDAQTENYCTNDVAHLPALQGTYTKRINSQCKKKVMDESARRVVEACSPEYEPQSENKKLGPWGSESGTKTLTMDKYLENYDDERIDSMEKDMFCDSDYDDVRGV